jgi:hypothetical protein
MDIHDEAWQFAGPQMDVAGQSRKALWNYPHLDAHRTIIELPVHVVHIVYGMHLA